MTVEMKMAPLESCDVLVPCQQRQEEEEPHIELSEDEPRNRLLLDASLVLRASFVRNGELRAEIPGAPHRSAPCRSRMLLDEPPHYRRDVHVLEERKASERNSRKRKQTTHRKMLLDERPAVDRDRKSVV